MEKHSTADKADLYKKAISTCFKLVLPKTPKAILKTLIWYQINKDAIFVSQKKIAQKLKLNIRTIERGFQVLYEHGYVVRRYKKSFFRTNQYLLNLHLFPMAEGASKPAPRHGSEKKRPVELPGNLFRAFKALPVRSKENPIESSSDKKEDAGSHRSNVIPFHLSESEQKVAEEMIQIMDHETQGVIKPDPSYRCTARKLVHHLKYTLGNDMERWKSFCQSAGCSSYLMGKSNGFLPPLLWLIKEETITKLRAREFHREPKKVMRAPQRSSYRSSGSATYPQENSADQEIEKTVAYNRQLRAMSLSVEENAQHRQAFEEKMGKENSWISDEFKRSGWESSFVKASFLDYKIHAVCGSFQNELAQVLAKNKEMKMNCNNHAPQSQQNRA